MSCPLEHRLQSAPYRCDAAIKLLGRVELSCSVEWSPDYGPSPTKCPYDEKPSDCLIVAKKGQKIVGSNVRA
jgi:hypothetical protein